MSSFYEEFRVVPEIGGATYVMKSRGELDRALATWRAQAANERLPARIRESARLLSEGRIEVRYPGEWIPVVSQPVDPYAGVMAEAVRDDDREPESGWTGKDKYLAQGYEAVRIPRETEEES